MLSTDMRRNSFPFFATCAYFECLNLGPQSRTGDSDLRGGEQQEVKVLLFGV
jgi:hypothetical protein